MPVHPLDFEIQAHLFSTPESSRIFEEKSRFQRWLDFEAALATSQAELGIIPKEAATEIEQKARLSQLDLNFIREEYTKNRNSLVPVLKALRQACGKYGEYVHYGATTQDAIDTGQILEIKETVAILYRDSRQLEKIVLDLSARYRDVPMIGRSHSQQAIPITFGLKATVWLTEIRRHIERLKSLAERVFYGQLSGAVGSMAALGERGPEVAAKTMSQLGLKSSLSPWHTSRDNIAETASCFTLICTTAAKIANEIFQLGKSEIMELREPASPGKSAGSSTMPHKRNPVICERIVVLSSHIRALLPLTIEGMIHENERDPRALWSEWLAMPQICMYAATSLFYLKEVLQGLEVSPDQMLKNLSLHKEAILSEWLLFRIGKIIGKSKAHEKVNFLLSQTGVMSLKELLLADEDIGPDLTSDDFIIIDHPEKYTGQSSIIVDNATQEISRERTNDPKEIT